MEKNLRTADYLYVDTAIALYQFMRNDNLGGEEIGIFNVIDYL